MKTPSMASHFGSYYLLKECTLPSATAMKLEQYFATVATHNKKRDNSVMILIKDPVWF